MKIDRKIVILFIKVFAIIFITGIFIPYLINIFLNTIINNGLNFNNSIYVMDNSFQSNSFLKIFIKLLSKIIDF